MFETPFTIVGTIVTDPIRRRVGDQELIKFRVASNSRRRGPDGKWVPGDSLFVTVNCWGRLVTGVGAALGKGDAVIAVGHVYTSEYEDREGARRSSVEMRANAVGPDVSRSLVRIIEKISNGGKAAEPGSGPEESAESADKSPDDPDASTDDDESPVGTAVPLSA